MTIPAPSSLSRNGTVPVSSTDDVLAAFPKSMRGDGAPIRDDLISAMTEMFLTYQEKAEYTARQSSPLTATGIYLAGFGDDAGVHQLPGEDQEDFRTRLLATPGLVTPAAIMAAVTAIVAPYSDVLPQYLESQLDGNFITDGTATYDSTFVGASPNYPDRLYPEQSVDDSPYRPQSEPGGFWVFADNIGRYFVLRIPDLTGADTLFAWMSDADDDASYISDGTDLSGAESDGSVITFMYASTLTESELYDSIVATVEAIKGHGIRFQVFVDPALV
jgi:hypothetical protein